MADFAITVSNQIQCFGIGPSTKWGSGNMTWGVSKWGEGTNPLVFDVEKAWGESQAISQSLSTVMDFVLSLSESIASTFEMSSETLREPEGYYYVFRRPSADAENQIITQYTSGSVASQTYSSFTATSTTWS